LRENAVLVLKIENDSFFCEKFKLTRL
jgi:hypothetical protein